MRLIYELTVISRVRLAFVPKSMPLVMGDIRSEVDWTVEGQLLIGARLTFVEQPVSSGEPIMPASGFEETAFRFAAYVANAILRQTGIDVIDARTVLHRSPRFEPETEEEKTLLTSRKMTVFAGSMMDAVVTKPFDPSNIGRDVGHAPALALYADGLRASDPFVRFEMFYRVMEYFFPNPQNYAPQHMRNFPGLSGKNMGEIRDQVQYWDKLRLRSVHPRPRADPALHRDDLGALREVRKHEPGMARVAKWLLDNPPP